MEKLPILALEKWSLHVFCVLQCAWDCMLFFQINHLTLKPGKEVIGLLLHFVLSSHSTVVGSCCSLGLPISLVPLSQCSLLGCPDICGVFCISVVQIISAFVMVLPFLPAQLKNIPKAIKLKTFLSETSAFKPLSAHVLWGLFDFLFRNMSREGACVSYILASLL